MNKPRIVVSGAKLAAILYVWLRDAPHWVWGKEPGYERLRAQRRHDPNAEPDPKREVANLLAAELERLDWTVSYEERGNIFADPLPGDGTDREG